ncbi:hypothetical protein pb186bvf_011194 [Paramecium bursaria]
MIQNKKQLCGLENLGNTCFMNSSLQVFINTDGISDYFLNDCHQEDINLINPLGSQGEVVQALAQLIKDMAKSKKNVVRPTDFKRVIAKHYYQYEGNQQHDAAEFLTCLLDCINEDLNLVKQKPYIDLPDTQNRDDIVVALEQWDAHTQRNQSIIVDLFHGQYKNKMTCPHCKYQSISFDAYMSVQLPLDTKNDKQVPIYILDQNQTKKKLDIPLLKDYDIQWLKDKIRDHLMTENVQFDFCNMEKNEQVQLYETLLSLKQRGLKVLARPLTDYEICVQGLGMKIQITHIDQQERKLTETITYIRNKSSTIADLFRFVEQTFGGGFDLYLQSQPNDSKQNCQKCGKFNCRYCYLPISNKPLSEFQQFHLVIKWFNQREFQCDQQQLTLQDCLHFFQQQQQLDAENPWYCKGCKQHVRGFKQLQLYSCPQNLILHLKRFKNSQHERIKNDSFVRYPHLLDLSKQVINRKLPTHYLNDGDPSLRYQLYAVVNHYGDLDFGHYNAYVKGEQGTWFMCDDSQIYE